MATNPNNAVGTNGAFGGRTSVNAFNDVLSIFNSRGIVQGWGMAPNSGMIINLGGDGSTRDVAVAEDNIGNKTTINNISEEPIPVEIPAAPATGSRIDAVVAYVDNPAQGSATITDNYGACGLIVVSGSAGASPTAPTESAIRSAITADGGAGSVAYYVVIGTVTVASGTTDISANMLTQGAYAGVTADNVDFTTFDSKITTAMLANTSVTAGKIDFSTFANNQSNIRKIYVTTFTATTDNNGFMSIPTSTLRPSTGVPLGGKINTAGVDGYVFMFCNNSESKWGARISGWDYTPVGNRSLSVTIYYVLS